MAKQSVMGFEFTDVARGEGGYCFLSHSHKDVAIVREIRNAMEAQGFEPLMFHLKCITDHDELDTLIKRELKARELFVYCDSRNARNSLWVRRERAYVDSLPGKRILRVNIDTGETTQSIAGRIMDSMRVFLSYVHADREIVGQFADALKQRELRVFYDGFIQIGQNWVNTIADGIKNASNHGAFVVFLSENSIHSFDVQAELSYAYTNHSLIIPIIIGENLFSKMPDELRYYLASIQSLRYRNVSDVSYICNQIEDALIRKFNEISGSL